MNDARRLRGFALVPCLAATACHDVTRFSNTGDHYEGAIVASDFVRAGMEAGTNMCVTLDATRLQDGPGSIRTSDGLFSAAPLRPIPEIWHDPLSTLSFGEGRVQNLVYVASPDATEDASAGAAATGDVFVVLSLMTSGGIEVRLLRGAPVQGAAATNLFGVFSLTRAAGSCSF